MKGNSLKTSEHFRETQSFVEFLFLLIQLHVSKSTILFLKRTETESPSMEIRQHIN